MKKMVYASCLDFKAKHLEKNFMTSARYEHQRMCGDFAGVGARIGLWCSKSRITIMEKDLESCEQGF